MNNAAVFADVPAPGTAIFDYMAGLGVRRDLPPDVLSAASAVSVAVTNTLATHWLVLRALCSDRVGRLCTTFRR
jgi:hypothetical protein